MYRVTICLFLLLVAYSSVFAQDPQDEIQRQIEVQKLRALESGLDRDFFGQDFLYEFGGWYRSSFFTFERGDDRIISWIDQDLRAWFDVGLFGNHRTYLRVREQNVFYSNGDNPEGEGNDSLTSGPRIDVAFYEYRINDLLIVGDNYKIKTGRLFNNFGSGFIYNLIADGVNLDCRHGSVETHFMATQTLRNQDDIDQSRPTHDNSKRQFFGVQVDLNLFADHTPYFIYLAQKDKNEETDPNQRFEFNSNYFAVGSQGKIKSDYLYNFEFVYENGERAAYEAGCSCTDMEDVSAYALLGRLKYFTGEKFGFLETVYTFEYIFGSGDSNRSSVTNTIQGNKKDTDDLTYLGFGYLFTGYVLSPRVSNLHILHMSLSGIVEKDKFDRNSLEAGADFFVYRKHKSSGGITDPFASPFNGFKDKDIGEEISGFVNWKLYTDLSFTARAAIFNQGHAYEDNDKKYFFGIGLVYVF